jgi:hypothetical protein
LRTDLFADGLDLLRIRAAADYEKIGEGRDFAQVEHSNVDRFLRFGGPDGSEPGRDAKRCRDGLNGGGTLLSDS